MFALRFMLRTKQCRHCLCSLCVFVCYGRTKQCGHCRHCIDMFVFLYDVTATHRSDIVASCSLVDADICYRSLVSHGEAL